MRLKRERNGWVRPAGRGPLPRLLAALAAVVTTGALTLVATATPASAISAVRQMSVGFKHTCAVTVVYDLFCWGDNSSGQLGDGTTTRRLKPKRIGAAGKWKSVAAGKDHTCGLYRTGVIYCWGRYDMFRSSLTPTPGDGDWDQITAGWYHTCGVKTNNTAYCWGNNAGGQLGMFYAPPNGFIDTCRRPDGQLDRCRPHYLDPPWYLPGGGYHVAAYDLPTMLSEHSADDPTIDDLDFGVPQGYVLADRWATIEAGASATCGLTLDGDRYCWGPDHMNALGLGDIQPILPPPGSDQFDNPTGTPEDDHITWTSVGMGANQQGCGISSGTRLYCWGANDSGQLGLGDTSPRSLPTRVDRDYEQISPGTSHTCGVKTNGTGYCWGANNRGQLGNGTTTDSTTPKKVVTSSGTTMQWQMIDSGAGYSCGLTSDNALYCWGWNDQGQLGDNTTTDRTTPHQVA